MDTQFWIGFVTIVISDLILSGDNAVVIGMATRKLPTEHRKKAIMIGAGLAILLRAALTAVAAWLLDIPLLMSVGGLLLLWIAMKLMQEDGEEADVEAGKDLRSAIKTIIIADVVMSLDNVIAVAGAAHGNLYLILFGLALSIPLILWGSRWIAEAMNRFPWLIYLGSGILGYVGGDLIVSDKIVTQYLLQGMGGLKNGIPIVLAILVIVIGLIWRRTHTNHRTA